MSFSGVFFWWFCSDFQRESDAEKARLKPFVKAGTITCNTTKYWEYWNVFSWNHRIKDWYANYMIYIYDLFFHIFSKWRVFAATTHIWLHLITYVKVNAKLWVDSAPLTATGCSHDHERYHGSLAAEKPTVKLYHLHGQNSWTLGGSKQPQLLNFQRMSIYYWYK